MGYYTSFYGDIALKSKKAIKIIKNLIKKEIYPFDYSEVSFDKNTLNINVNGKNWEEQIQKICLFVATLDKKSSGEISCEGEEAGDIWRIKVESGKVYVNYAKVSFSEEDKAEYNDNELKKKVYEVNKDKQLLKEIIVGDL